MVHWNHKKKATFITGGEKSNDSCILSDNEIDVLFSVFPLFFFFSHPAPRQCSPACIRWNRPCRKASSQVGHDHITTQVSCAGTLTYISFSHFPIDRKTIDYLHFCWCLHLSSIFSPCTFKKVELWPWWKTLHSCVFCPLWLFFLF